MPLLIEVQTLFVYVVLLITTISPSLDSHSPVYVNLCTDEDWYAVPMMDMIDPREEEEINDWRAHSTNLPLQCTSFTVIIMYVTCDLYKDLLTLTLPAILFRSECEAHSVIDGLIGYSLTDYLNGIGVFLETNCGWMHNN